MNLATAFLESARKAPEKAALFWGEAEYSYGHLNAQSQRLASALGIQPGERVGIWLRNCPEFVPAVFGILAAGGVVVPINNFLKPQEVSFILQDAGIRTLISEAGMAEPLSQIAAAHSGLRVISIEQFAKFEAEGVSAAEPLARKGEDLAVIIYTSGTTGHPKGAMLTHGNLAHNIESCRIMLEAVSYDRFVLLLPMFHSFMLTVCILTPLLVGGSIVLIKSVHPPKSILMEILARKATILPAIPQFFRALLGAPLPPNIPLRLCISGAAPLPRELLREFGEKFPIPLLEGYGLSEASPVVSFNPIHGPWKAGSVGVASPGVEASIQNDAGERLPPGETGEICVRGGNVMAGYWNNPEESAKSLVNGWLLTGDIGHMDADGYIYITDRKKDMLLVNGINVYPREIEEILYQYPGVKEAAVIGVPDSRKGEQALAFVAANEGAMLDEKEMLRFVRERLADYKVPKRVVTLPALPRNATGKILKTALRKMEAPA